MSVERRTNETAELRAQNIGGIDETDVSFTPGVTVLEGRNATNRSSLLRALMAVCGSDDVSIKGDSDEAEVELTMGSETYTRSLRRTNGTVQTSGAPYLEDSTLSDLFAFLLESNETRTAVARGDDLQELILRPVDTDAIEAEIDRFVQKRREREAELAEIDSMERELPELEEDRIRLRNQIEEKREELQEKESKLDEVDVDVEEKRGEQAEIEAKLDELRDVRGSLEDVRYEIETERESVDALREEKAELDDEEVQEVPAGEIDELESEIEQIRERKRSSETEINEIQSVIRFNEEALNESHRKLLASVDSGGEKAVTDGLIQSERTTCWTCGTAVEIEQIQSTIDRLRELNKKRLDEVREIQAELDDLKDQRRDLKEQRQQRERVDRRLSQISDQIQEREASIDRLSDRRDELTQEVESIEAEVENREDESYGDVLDLHKEINDIEYELGRLESDYERVDDEITSIEARLAEREELSAEREELQDEITHLRTKIERITEQAVEAFNEHMDNILDLLEYGNLERIWLERIEDEVREGRRKEAKSKIEVHVVRSRESGTSYEDTVDHLSESEREVTGLIFALAGYLAHDVHEVLPFLVLDSLEAIDAERISSLIEYLSDYSTFLIVALLPEDAASLDDEYQRVSQI